MGRHVEVADARAIRERHRDGRLQAALSPSGFEEMRNGPSAAS
jgi:hypothetical protein